MKLIKSLEIDHFRSIKSQKIEGLGHFSAFAGLNNAGKSNALRALHAFFSGFTDINTPIEYKRDYYRYELRSKKRRKNINIAVEFSLPELFKFRHGLQAIEDFLGRTFVIKKVWQPAVSQPQYFLNDRMTELSLPERLKIDQFLALINFRYIPNRVLPLDIIRSEHRALRDSLVRRLARTMKGQEGMFDQIQRISDGLIQTLQVAVTSASPDIGSIRLDTPTSWQDLVFAFGYKLSTGGIEIDDAAQGSGIQSLLMLETLALIDRDYFQKFGWKQAAVWALEEPESSLHTSLEAKVASYLSNVAQESKSRLQIISTTHSDLMLQNADHTIFVVNNKGQSEFNVCDKKKVLEEAATRGISRYSHPILAHPLTPIVLVEGKYDYSFVKKAINLLDSSSSIIVSYLGMLHSEKTGGTNDLLQFLKVNSGLLRVRIADAPVLVLLDWDSKGKKREFEKICDDGAYQVHVWPDTSFNPSLGASFHGIERHMSDRIIDLANENCGLVGTTTDGKKIVEHSKYGEFKSATHKVVNFALFLEDLEFVNSFLKTIIQTVK